MGELAERIPPQDINAEAAVLGAMLIDGGAVRVGVAELEAKHFYRSAHRRIFACCKWLFDNDRPVDEIVLRATLQEYGILEEIGGGEYLYNLAAAVPSAASIDEYCRRVRKLAGTRSLIAAARAVLKDAEDPGCDPAEAAAKAVERLQQAQTGAVSRPPVRLADSVVQSVEWAKGAPIKSGIGPLDGMTGCVRLGGLTYISGPSGAGKTTLALNIIANAAKEGTRCYVFSDDQVHQELSAKIHSAEVGRCKEAAWDTDEGPAALERMEQWPFFYHPDELTLSGVASTIRIEAGRGTKVFLLDMLQGVRVEKDQMISKLYEKDEVVSGKLKTLSKELGVAVIGIVEWRKRSDKKRAAVPTHDEMKGGGGIIHDADQIWIVWPPEDGADESEAHEIWVTKTRFKRSGFCVKLKLDGALNRFERMKKVVEEEETFP